VKKRIEHRLDELIGGLNGMVERALQKHGFNSETLNLNDQLNRKTDRKTDTNRREAPESESPIWNGQAVPTCPVCGVNPHNWAFHEEWRRLPEATSKKKIAADREAYPAHECVDRPTLPCPACLKWTGDGFAAVKNNPQCFPGIDITNKTKGRWIG
jgi:hypothetical protein